MITTVVEESSSNIINAIRIAFLNRSITFEKSTIQKFTLECMQLLLFEFLINEFIFIGNQKHLEENKTGDL
ncbi:hypothetical protein T4D_1581 [Trichinella pseudospiralis]|uniref:Uncharacterized protein n=1 Tax=Trichinella pseudospiralis TaxID=6337 RepID=A0A0V1FYX6_TRIPS|nr:hypothetical protein T4D_1581 [Trichinella pseudospiralis]